MDLGMVGLGKMGLNMAKRLLRGGHRVVAWNRSEGPREAAAAAGAEVAAAMEDIAVKLSPPRTVWMMLPAGDTTELFINALTNILSAGDVLIDGSNSHYKDTVRRGAVLEEKGIQFLDVGTSDGIWGLTEGYSMMIGGEDAVVERLRPVVEALAPVPNRGWARVGPNGAGHFVKMVHKGIEYGLMQAYTEGFELMQQKADFHLDLHQVAEIWRYGSVIRSWLLGLVAQALADNPRLDGIAAWVEDSGEGRWTVQEGIDVGVAMPVISSALQQRFRSRQDAPFSDKLLAALRHQFGRHDVKQE